MPTIFIEPQRPAGIEAKHWTSIRGALELHLRSDEAKNELNAPGALSTLLEKAGLALGNKKEEAKVLALYPEATHPESSGFVAICLNYAKYYPLQKAPLLAYLLAAQKAVIQEHAILGKWAKTKAIVANPEAYVQKKLVAYQNLARDAVTECLAVIRSLNPALVIAAPPPPKSAQEILTIVLAQLKQSKAPLKPIDTNIEHALVRRGILRKEDAKHYDYELLNILAEYTLPDHIVSLQNTFALAKSTGLREMLASIDDRYVAELVNSSQGDFIRLILARPEVSKKLPEQKSALFFAQALHPLGLWVGPSGFIGVELLIYFASIGNAALVTEMMNADTGVRTSPTHLLCNYEDRLGNTALHHAASKGYCDVLNALIMAGVHFHHLNKRSQTALEIAVVHSKHIAAQTLLNEAKPVEKCQALLNAASFGNSNMLSMLISSLANYFAKQPNEKLATLNKSLYYAAANGHDTVVADLLNAGAQVNAYDSLNPAAPSALHVATRCERTYTRTIKSLLKADAAVNGADGFGRTALHNAATQGHHYVAQLLLRKGANPNLHDSQGNTPLDDAVVHGDNDTLYYIAIAASQATKDKALLTAAKHGHTNAALLLLKEGASHAATDENGKTVLQTAQYGNYIHFNIAFRKATWNLNVAQHSWVEALSKPGKRCREKILDQGSIPRSHRRLRIEPAETAPGYY